MIMTGVFVLLCLLFLVCTFYAFVVLVKSVPYFVLFLDETLGFASTNTGVLIGRILIVLIFLGTVILDYFLIKEMVSGLDQIREVK